MPEMLLTDMPRSDVTRANLTLADVTLADVTLADVTLADVTLADVTLAEPALAVAALAEVIRADLRLPDAPLPGLPGQRLARGVARALRAMDFVTVEELVPSPGLRVDLMALGPKGEVWVIECKSGRADFRADQKWQFYLEYCDRFFWAVDADFPTELLPEGSGLILADAYDAEIVRMGAETPLPGARRKALLHKFARHAAARLHAFRDTGVAGLVGSP